MSGTVPGAWGYSGKTYMVLACMELIVWIGGRETNNINM